MLGSGLDWSFFPVDTYRRIPSESCSEQTGKRLDLRPGSPDVHKIGLHINADANYLFAN